MTKNERIRQLEDKIRALETRIVMLEARPLWPWYRPTEPIKPIYPIAPTWTGDNTGTVCTCGVLSGICPVHGGLLAIGNTSVAILGINTGYVE